MSDDVLLFIPKHEAEHEKNVKDFIDLIRAAPELNNIDCESYYWPTIGNFTKFAVSSKNREIENRLDESLIPFAKAYIKYHCCPVNFHMRFI